MRKYLLIIALLYCSHAASAQTKFTYDAAGNRLTRKSEGTLVQLNVKVYLQGAYKAALAGMSNHLQNYFGGNAGLLPKMDAYGSGAVYNNIGNPAGVAGAVVDWVKVEIRKASDPSVILQTKSLLLKTNGNVVDMDGTVPKFFSETVPVHIIVKHRNHLAVMSSVVPAFSAATVTHDFTTALARAFAVAGDPPQLTNISGKWAMSAGDLNQDYGVDATDHSIGQFAFGQGIFGAYNPADINMDGIVDSIDTSIMMNALGLGYYSSLYNFDPLL
ncbi:hypothetical protein MUK70_27780 [Dyadobacter chenwenxiniae]|uniref:YD repeat-containing protein n=1 Tax=Dyadobacter chenwenxiniae TaxID=2906456 RepID=A0A9X1PMK0_9BACT|nr:hypothetical protein [Dyadobacter chenwenxiniae]MCF0064082.1 hypothetical protein [Dyadobacter chenwenxiniae]UON82810.1 hypothetical protein MUK70_27780 [Dyadobacter chenwenxiniae]